MYLQELNSIRNTQFDLENLIKQRARSNPSFLTEIKLLFEIITHDVLHLQSSMLKQFRGLEIQVSTFGTLLSNKLEITQKLSDLSAFQAQFNIILEIQADLEKQLRKKKWYKNRIDLVVRVFPSVSEQSNSVLQNQILVSEKSLRNPKRKIEKEKTINLPENINSVEIEQNNEINPNLPKKRIDEISLGSHSYCPVAMEEQTHESSLPHSVSLSQDLMSTNTQDNYVNKLISSNTIIDNPQLFSEDTMSINTQDNFVNKLISNNTIIDDPQLFSQETSPSKTMDLSQTLPISSLSINQTQTQEDNFSSMLFDCMDIFPIKTGHGSLMESQPSMLITNSPILGQKNNHASFINRDIPLKSQEIQSLTQSPALISQSQALTQTQGLTQSHGLAQSQGLTQIQALAQTQALITQTQDLSQSQALTQTQDLSQSQALTQSHGLTQSQALTQSQEISQHELPWYQTGNITKETNTESTNNETLTDTMNVSRDPVSECISTNKTIGVPNSVYKLENMKMSLSQCNTVNLNSNESGLIRILPKKQCTQNKSNIHFLGNFRQKESFGKSMICKQKKYSDSQKQAPSQTKFDFIFPTKQKSILHYVSPPRNNPNNLEITNRFQNEISEQTNLSSLKNQKISDKTLHNKIDTNSRKINTRSFYKLSVLMISRDEITYDLPTTIWDSENLPEEVITQLELDLNFW